MAGHRDGLRAESHITVDGVSHAWDSLTDGEREMYGQRLAENRNQAMSRYYSGHPEEYAGLLRALESDAV